MTPAAESKLLRIVISETYKVEHTPLYEAIVQAALTADLAGATVWRGMLSYGHDKRVHTAKILTLSTELPVIIEIVDEDSKINSFLPVITKMFEKGQCGGLITIEQVQAIRYVCGVMA